jgi:hypothetical protein
MGGKLLSGAIWDFFRYLINAAGEFPSTYGRELIGVGLWIATHHVAVAALHPFRFLLLRRLHPRRALLSCIPHGKNTISLISDQINEDGLTKIPTRSSFFDDPRLSFASNTVTHPYQARVASGREHWMLVYTIHLGVRRLPYSSAARQNVFHRPSKTRPGASTIELDGL